MPDATTTDDRLRELERRVVELETRDAPAWVPEVRESVARCEVKIHQMFDLIRDLPGSGRRRRRGP